MVYHKSNKYINIIPMKIAIQSILSRLLSFIILVDFTTKLLLPDSKI